MAYVKEETVFNEEQWKDEAEAIINDVKDHVKDIILSPLLKGSDQDIYFNVTTLEGLEYCVHLSAHGFRIVGRTHDTNSQNDGHYFETPYSLLNSISEKFRESFGNALVAKLQTLQ